MKEYTFRGKAITVIEPWASAIVYAGKDIENRNWRTHYRGPIAIHAGCKCYDDELQGLQRQVRGGPKKTLEHWIRKGQRRVWEECDLVHPSHVVGIGMLVDCVDRSSSPWFSGDWGWVLQGVIPIYPVPMKGALGLWNCKFKFRPAT